MRFARSWALRSRLGAGGARRTSRIAQQSLKNQKPFSKENQRAPGLTPPSPAGNSSRTTFKACNLAQHRTRGLQSDWSASQTEKSTQNKGSRTRIPGFKPHKGLRFQKTCPGGSLWPHLFRRRPCGRDPKRPATKGGKGTESRDLLETRRLPPLKARGSRESSHGRRRKRRGQLDRFFENAALHGE